MGTISRVVLPLAFLVACKKNPAAPGSNPTAPSATATVPGAVPGTVPGAAPANPGSVIPNLPSGMMQNPIQAMAQLQNLQAAPGATMVNWRTLGTFLPNTLTGFTADGELRGSSDAVMGMQVSHARRNYKSGERSLQIEILDTTLMPAMRSMFAVVGTLSEDSSEGIRRGTAVSGNPALLEWQNSGNRSKIDALIAGRFIVKVEVQPASNPEEASTIAGQLNLAGLAAAH